MNISGSLLDQLLKVVGHRLVKGAQVLQNELKDGLEALDTVLHGEHGVQVKGTLNFLEESARGLNWSRLVVTHLGYEGFILI
jgi:hypothetical protein